MATYTMDIRWQRGEEEAFLDNRYSRGHQWLFDGGIALPASSSPHVVPLPHSLEAAVDPEEAFVASIASCHMLWFLSIAASMKLVVERYEDHPVGVLAKNAEGHLAMTKVDLRPAIVFLDPVPSPATIHEIHHRAHEACFIARSVKTEIRILE